MKDSASLLLDSSSMSVDSAPISVESSYLSLSSMTPRLSRSPRRLTSMKNHSTSLSILWPSSTKSNRKVKVFSCVSFSDGRIKRHEGEGLAEFQSMWSIKQQDLPMKERLSKMSLLDSLIAKKEPLADYEEALKKKLITELLFT
ncbi:hypothetical protein Bca52824_065641 [Brassica carinata]|uniref:Uncharacterized protein n=1 Tax=Brassica carinata TaxID=52824 RepID=A0A8X7UCL6_BRACI|nr:hypothetical protein Bca52824_065641 [Brassica carinata]